MRQDLSKIKSSWKQNWKELFLVIYDLKIYQNKVFSSTMGIIYCYIHSDEIFPKKIKLPCSDIILKNQTSKWQFVSIC